MQATLAEAVRFDGVGVHRGEAATMMVRPAPADAGVVFRRTDIEGKPNRIAARYDAVVDTQLCTVIGNKDGATVSTVEHLMAALAGVGVSNALVDIDGPETPIMDGSSEPFVQGLLNAGIERQAVPRWSLKVEKRVEVATAAGRAALSPAPRFEMSFEIDFSEAAIGRQRRSMAMVNGVFVEDLCRARTFGRLQDVEKLRSMGLARGGSLDNAIVVDGDRVLNSGGLRYDDEFVRHKMLDAVGDLALAGAPIIGRYEGVRAGHDLTNRLLRALFEDPSNYRWIDDEVSPLTLGVRPFSVAA